MLPPNPINKSIDVGYEELNLRYVWMIAFVAALGGLLFGYDWVVIGGAKPFYETYFHLNSARLVGWANSCALIGCFVGSICGGRLSNRFGRKYVLFFAALLFAISSILTGWSYYFEAFIAWRIVGGVAIGLASNISPTYIAEISPAAWRGRLVSLNQLALVIGILAAQIVNWSIAGRSIISVTDTRFVTSWNVQYGWRWMFTVVAVPAVILLVSAPFIPESPRWLMGRGRLAEAADVLKRIGGERYSQRELTSIEETLRKSTRKSSWRGLLTPKLRQLLFIGVALAVLQQGSGINILFNYAEEVYRSAGYGVSDVLFNIVITGTINLLFTVLAMLLVDRVGRRRLMLIGCVSIGICHLVASFAYHVHLQGFWVLALTLCAIACYAMSLAPITWILITEIFPNAVRASAISISIGALWVASFVLTYTFPLLNHAVGASGAFLVYAVICLGGAVFVYFTVPETSGRSLENIEEGS
jgi:SP family xylose:H+ symportor-like MFS transporter